MDSNLLSSIRTRSEAEELESELELLKASLFKDGEMSFNSTLESNIRFWVAEMIKDEIREKDIEEYLEKVIDQIQLLNEIKLTLAFEPSNSGINRILGYVRNNIDDSLILDIEYDPSILGGIKLSYKGIYHDYSLKKLFNNEFEAKRDKFMKLLDKN